MGTTCVRPLAFSLSLSSLSFSLFFLYSPDGGFLPARARRVFAPPVALGMPRAAVLVVVAVDWRAEKKKVYPCVAACRNDIASLSPRRIARPRFPASYPPISRRAETGIFLPRDTRVSHTGCHIRRTCGRSVFRCRIASLNEKCFCIASHFLFAFFFPFNRFEISRIIILLIFNNIAQRCICCPTALSVLP